MGRQKKSLSLQVEEKLEVIMSDTQTLETIETEIDIKRAELEKVKFELEEKKQEAKKLPLRELDENEKKIDDRRRSFSIKNAAAKEKIEQQKEFDSVMVTGKFINRRAPGQPAKLTYMKYETDPVKWYNFEDGKVYTIPRGFADQINEYYHTPKFIQTQGEMDPNRPASAIHEVDTSNKKYSFVPVNF